MIKMNKIMDIMIWPLAVIVAVLALLTTMELKETKHELVELQIINDLKLAASHHVAPVYNY